MTRPPLLACIVCLPLVEPCLADAPKDICINEISAIGIGHDWVELYNASPVTIDCRPLILRDSLDASGNALPLCVSSLKPGERRTVTCPNLLNGNGEELALFDIEGKLIDSATYGRQTFNLTYGRRTDGAEDWCYQHISERLPNGTVPEDVPPVIVAAPYHWPLSPGANEPVLVSAAVVAAEGLASVEVLFVASEEKPGPAAEWTRAPCQDDGTGDDERAGDGRYTGGIPGFPAGTAVYYRFHAVDYKGNETVAPSEEDAFGVRFGYTPPPIRINEILVSNRSNVRYKNGEEFFPSDWIELHNARDEAMDLTGWSLSDRRTTALTFPLLGKGLKVIPAKGYLLIWAQRHIPEELEDAVGVNFSLSRNGEEIVLFAADGFSVVDSVAYPLMASDASYGRVPDGSGEFQILESPTPAGGTTYPPRRVEVLSYEPLLPAIGEPVTVKVWISQALSVESAEIYHWLMDESRTPLFDDGTHGDATAGDRIFTTQIGPFHDSGGLHFAAEVKARDTALLRDPEPQSLWYQIPLSWRPSGFVKINEVFAAGHLCCCGCMAFQSVTGPLEPRNFVEVRNTGNAAASMSELYLTDDPLDYKKAKLVPVDYKEKLAPGAHHVAWYYGGDETLVLSPEGGVLFLTDGKKVLDAVTYGAAVAGQAYGYFPQDSESWGLGDPSPGSPNGDSFFLRADGNADLELDLTDAVVALHHLFGGEPGDCVDALDADDSGVLELTDPIYLLGYLFLGGPAPLAPFPDLGPDATPDPLDCETFSIAR